MQAEGSKRHGGCCRLSDDIGLNDLMWRFFKISIHMKVSSCINVYCSTQIEEAFPQD